MKDLGYLGKEELQCEQKWCYQWCSTLQKADGINRKEVEKKLVGVCSGSQQPEFLFPFQHKSSQYQRQSQDTTRKDLHTSLPPLPRKATQKRDWEFQRAALEPGIFIQRSTGKLRRFIPYLLLILLQEIVIKWRKGQIKGLWIIVPSPKETSGGIQQVPESGSDPGVRTAPHCGLVAHPSLWSYWALWNP